MSNRNKLKTFSNAMTFIAISISLVALYVSYQTNQRLDELLQQDSTHIEAKDYHLDPFAQGNAPEGGGPNASSGPGIYQALPEYPLSTPRINPEPPLVCSTATVSSSPFAQGIATFVVPEGWSVWECIKERFSHYDDRDLMDSVNYLKLQIKMDPSLKVRDPNVVPVGYTFVMGASDGAGPGPIE